MASDIPYPHQIEIRRPNPSMGQDDYGRPLIVGEQVEVVPAWVQERTARQKASFAAMGAEVSTHVIFMEPRAFSVGEYFVTVPGGGLFGAEKHRIVGVRNPAGVGAHYEVDTIMVGTVESS